MLPVFIVSYGIEKCIREITSGSVMCRYKHFDRSLIKLVASVKKSTKQRQEVFNKPTLALSLISAPSFGN